ncbi:MAG: hypothetical protein IT204_25425 [Fimbriimonadaceae bacterium]|nr:hypothetical protein [Fimbriimonadaceae bacterium]
MRQRGRLGRSWLGLVLLATCVGSAAPPPGRWEAGVWDLAELLPGGRARVLTEKIAAIRSTTGVEFLILLIRGDEGTPADAAALLTAWVAQPPNPLEVPPPTVPATGPPRRGVLLLHLTSGGVTCAVTPTLDRKVTAALRYQVVTDQLKPALASRSTSAVGDALSVACDRLGKAVGLTAAAAPASAAPAAEPPFEPRPLRPWLSWRWLVLLPTLLVGAVLAVRLGLARAVGLSLPALLLYLGLFCLLRFRVEWFMVAGCLAVLPVAFAWTTPELPREPRAARLGRRMAAPVVGRGGFGVTGFGALGAGGWEN